MTTKIETINTLFEKSKNSASSEAEKKSCIDMAKKLMEKHNISDQDLKAVEVKKIETITKIMWSFAADNRVITGVYAERLLEAAKTVGVTFNPITQTFKSMNKTSIEQILDLHNTIFEILSVNDAINNINKPTPPSKKPNSNRFFWIFVGVGVGIVIAIIF